MHCHELLSAIGPEKAFLRQLCSWRPSVERTGRRRDGTHWSPRRSDSRCRRPRTVGVVGRDSRSTRRRASDTTCCNARTRYLDSDWDRNRSRLAASSRRSVVRPMRASMRASTEAGTGDSNLQPSGQENFASSSGSKRAVRDELARPKDVTKCGRNPAGDAIVRAGLAITSPGSMR
jgi:hypothetical protein